MTCNVHSPPPPCLRSSQLAPWNSALSLGPLVLQPCSTPKALGASYPLWKNYGRPAPAFDNHCIYLH